jgi:glycosyltransferase involved in cell wall biosynthesis
MRIAINTRYLLDGFLEGYGYFLYETLSRITKDHPEHQFIFIFDRAFDKRFVLGSNVIPVVTGPPARHPLLWKLWYDIKVPSVLRKHKADLFVSADGFCSLTTKIPQCLVVHDLAFIHDPAFLKKSHLLFYKRYTSKFIKRANAIATVSKFSKKDILSNYPVEENKIDVVYSAAKTIFRPLTDEEREVVKNDYTGGKEYFVYTGSIHPRKNLVNLLKAFSIFKKRQQSNFKLVLAGRLAWKYGSFVESLKTYKYRDDVVMTGYLKESELARLTGAAYAMVYPSLLEGFGVPVLEAMQCCIPVVTSLGTSMEEITNGAALLADPHDHEAIANRMMQVYKDETLRKDLIAKGKQVAQQYSWDKTAELLWQSFMKAIK